MNPRIIILSIIIILAAFLIGGGAGILYQSQKPVQPQASNLNVDQMSSLIKQLTSKPIASIAAYGQIQSIDGKNIALSYLGDSITVKLADNAQVFSLAVDSKGKTSQQKVDFSQVKKGDNVSISLKLLPDGTLQGQTIMILPTIASPTTGSK